MAGKNEQQNVYVHVCDEGGGRSALLFLVPARCKLFLRSVLLASVLSFGLVTYVLLCLLI